MIFGIYFILPNGNPCCCAPLQMKRRLKNEAGLGVMLFLKPYCFLAPQMTQRFKKEAGLRVALLSVTAAGTGLDFSAASLVVFAELPSEVCQKRFRRSTSRCLPHRHDT